MTLASLSSPTYTGADLSTRVNAVLLEARSGRRFVSVAAILADTTMGYSNGKRPVAAGDRVVTADGFAYDVTLSAATDHHLTTAGGVRLKALPFKGAFTVRQFGGIEGGDITAATQAAIDAGAYGMSGSPALVGDVLIDVMVGTISGTVQLGYGKVGGVGDFRRVSVRGLGRQYSSDSKHMGTRITSTVTNAPTFAISNGRFSGVTDLSIVGPANDAIQAMDFAVLAPTLAATWDAALTSAGVTPNLRYAPHAAIAIDPYAGVAPAGAYPAVTVPAWSGGATYGRDASSSTRIERVGIYGFEVGVAQTPSDWNNNGDFLAIRDCDFQRVKWAVSVGNNQSRTVTVENCTFDRIFCALTNRRHGKQNGTVSGSWQGCGLAGFIGTLFDLSDGVYGGNLCFDSCDVESLHRIGDFTTGSSNEREVLFLNTTISFRHFLHDYSPANVLNVGNSKAAVRFVGGDLTGFHSMVSLRCEFVTMDHTTLTSQEAQAKTYEKIAHNATMGGLVIPILPHGEQKVRFEPFHIGTGAAHGTRLVVGSGYRYTGRNYLTPLYAGPVLREEDYLSRGMVGHRPSFYNNDSVGSNITAAVRVDRTITFTSNQITSINDREQKGYMPGDLIRDTATGTVMVIRSTDAGTGQIIAELQTNWRLNGAAYDLVDTSFSLTAGSWDFICARVYTPARKIVGTATTAAATITVKGQREATPADYGLAAGDFYLEKADPVSTFLSTGRAQIASVAAAGGGSGTTGTITMTGAPAQNLTDHAFDWWIRAAPANEAAR